MNIKSVHPNGTKISFNKTVLTNFPMYIEIKVANVVIIEISKISVLRKDTFFNSQKFESLKVSKCDDSDNNSGEKIFMDYLKNIDLILIYSKLSKVTKSNSKIIFAQTNLLYCYKI